MDEQFLVFLCAEPRNLRRQKYECIAEPLCIYVIGIVHLAIMFFFSKKCTFPIFISIVFTCNMFCL